MKSEVTSDNRELDQDTAEKFAAIRETIRSEMNRAADIAGMKSKTIKREALSAFKDLASDSVPYFESLRGTVDEQLGEVVKIVENSARAIKEAFDGIGEEIARNFSGTETAVRREMGDFQAIGSDKARDVANAFQNISYTIAGHFADVTSRVANTLTGMYDVGRNAAQAFANGLRSVHIDTPHLVTTSYSEYVIGDSRITVPNLSVQWRWWARWAAGTLSSTTSRSWTASGMAYTMASCPPWQTPSQEAATTAEFRSSTFTLGAREAGRSPTLSWMT